MSSTTPINLTNVMQPGAHEVSDASHTDRRPWLDRVGIGASLLCAIHCLAAPFLLLLLPAAGSVWSHPAVHWVLAVLVLPLALWVLYNGYRKHRSRLTLVAASLGALLIVAGLISPMVSSEPTVEFSVPAFLGEPAAALPLDGNSVDPAAATCTEPCCPSITYDAANNASIISMPPGGLLTLLGSVLLVLAHSANLIACRCFSKNNTCKGDGGSPCGCPA